MTKKKIRCIGLTGPSSFSMDCIRTIENFFSANPIQLYQNLEQNLFFALDQCDAVILAGGKDIHPRVYGGNIYNESNFTNFDIERDKREIKVIDYCLSNNIPIFGICRGHQMLGLYHGMPLNTDLTYSTVCHQPNRQQISLNKGEPTHFIKIVDKESPLLVKYEKGEALDRALNTGKVWVNSFHHQAIEYEKNKSYQDIKIIATAPASKDSEIVEAMSGKGWLSCQWHPEHDYENNKVSESILKMFYDMIKANEQN
jgi:gamma-glutamyl-gamma-aminobutyrate hydrolase PuuD